MIPDQLPEGTPVIITHEIDWAGCHPGDTATIARNWDANRDNYPNIKLDRKTEFYEYIYVLTSWIDLIRVSDLYDVVYQ